MDGCILGGDGSGGKFGRDPRTRRCGFGLVVLKPQSNDSDAFDYLGHVYGAVPGKQTVPRSEATVLWHALKYTSGNAVYMIDALGTMRSLSKGASYEPLSNGLLWQAINQAKQQRLDEGRGWLELVWIESHQTFEQAVNRGWSPVQWTANWYADSLADKATQLYQLDPNTIESTRDCTKAAVTLLRRHVDLCIQISPERSVAHGNRDSEDHEQIKSPHASREEQISGWARGAGHSLDSNHRCVRCALVVPIKRNLAYIESVLHMPCVGEQAQAFSSIKMQLFEGQSNGSLFLFGSVVLHDSHVMATHVGLHLHFCTSCGVHGTRRRNYLREPCAEMLRPSGREALRLISLGKHPNSYLKASLVRRRSKGCGVAKAQAKPRKNRRYGAWG